MPKGRLPLLPRLPREGKSGFILEHPLALSLACLLAGRLGRGVPPTALALSPYASVRCLVVGVKLLKSVSTVEDQVQLSSQVPPFTPLQHADVPAWSLHLC